MLTCNVIITLVPKIIIEDIQLMLLNDSITATISYKVKHILHNYYTVSM